MARTGAQEPTFSTVGDWASSDGPEAVAMFEGMGAEFAPAQAWELAVYLARNRYGRFAARTIALSKPRQNGKSHAARYYAVWMAAVEGARVLYTAHHGKTTTEMFKACVAIVGHPDLAELLKPGSAGIYRSKGCEGIYFADWEGEDGRIVPGGCIEFATRTNAGGRGGTYDVIIVDEAQEMTDEHRDALKPATIASESGDPQMIYLGTPPNEKCPGTVFRDLHDRAHAGEGGTAWWIEWAAEEVGDPFDRERWYRCVPMLGILIEEDVLADAADTTSPDGFAREYLGWWSRTSGEPPLIGRDAWDACATAERAPSKGRAAYAVKFSPDGRLAAMAVCVKAKKAAPFVQVVAAQSCGGGLGWLRRRVMERMERAELVILDGKGRSDTLRTLLVEDGADERKIKIAGTGDMVDAVSMLEEAVASRSVRHAGQPGLSDCAARCPSRKIGQGHGLGPGADGTAPEPMEACALAMLALKRAKRKKGKGLIG